MTSLPRIAKVTANSFALTIHWKGGGRDVVNLAGWIATGGSLLAPLSDPALFDQARPAVHGTAVAWGDDDDLMIDAEHLRLLAAEQKPFTGVDLRKWQAAVGISNQEAKDFLGIALSTYNAYKAGGEVPTAVALACRAALRDPIYLRAHLKPRRSGRPRRSVAA